ncbi:hypothetical protein HAX54_015008 [Datura stramonium]|uniref:Uncharacterized protein n=1 Tax=Datura stramonium TaxID=4076 RepID=A0ABS8RZQ2_DATST|nr:hypothetical protein [Datura stramonium]
MARGRSKKAANVIQLSDVKLAKISRIEVGLMRQFGFQSKSVEKEIKEQKYKSPKGIVTPQNDYVELIPKEASGVGVEGHRNGETIDHGNQDVAIGGNSGAKYFGGGKVDDQAAKVTEQRAKMDGQNTKRKGKQIWVPNQAKIRPPINKGGQLVQAHKGPEVPEQELEEGWETVRNKVASRTSPIPKEDQVNTSNPYKALNEVDRENSGETTKHGGSMRLDSGTILPNFS